NFLGNISKISQQVDVEGEPSGSLRLSQLFSFVAKQREASASQNALRHRHRGVPGKMSKVLITGASGMLGRVLMMSFPGVSVTGVALTRCRGGLARLDLRDDTAVRDFVGDLKPEIIIHAAAERRPDVSQQDPEGTRALNVHATANLARTAKEFGAWVLFLSTDYVFDGTDPPYSPTDAPHPLNFYGQTKLEGEQSLRKHLMDAGVLRVGVLYGQVETPDESAVTSVLNDVRSGETISVDHWGQRYPTLVDDVAVVCRQLTQRRLAGEKLSGTWHWCGNECFTKFEMAN